MKMKTTLLALACLLACSSTCAVATVVAYKSEPIAVRAEAPLEFEERTYTLETNGQTFVLTLKSETAFEVKIIKDGVEEVFTGTYIRSGDVITLSFAGQELKFKLNDEAMTMVNYVEDAKSSIEKWRETFLTPIFGAWCISDIVKLIAVIVVSIVYGKRKKQATIKAEENAEKLDELIKTYEGVVDGLKEQSAEAKELAKNALDLSKELLAKVDLQSQEIEKALIIKQVVSLMAEIEIAIASSNPKAVISGLSKKLDALKEQLAQL